MRHLVGVLTMAVLAAGCGETGGPDAGPGDGACAEDDGTAILTDSIRLEYATHTEVSMSLAGPPCGEEPTGELRIPVSMTNHSCSIPGYDDGFETKVRLESSDGASRSDARWEVSSTDDHHPAGTLIFEPSAEPLVGCDTDWIAVVLTEVDLSEGEHLRFEWSDEVLDPLRTCSTP